MINIIIAMFSLIILCIIWLLELTRKSNKKQKKCDITNYKARQYVMEYNELLFYRELKKITDKYNLTIFPQVDLQKIIEVKEEIENKKKVSKYINTQCVDYTIVKNNNYKIVCCIELDGTTHEQKEIKRKDYFKDILFKEVGIHLYRIKQKKDYNLYDIEKMIKESL